MFDYLSLSNLHVSYLTLFFSVIGFLSISTYLLPIIFRTLLYSPQNLKQKYAASWGLVTGASSGIGKEIAEKLASQGINVVLVALDDEMLVNAREDLQERYQNVTFKAVGVNLSMSNAEELVRIVDEQTRDLDINLVFNNAGFITTGMFHTISMQRNLLNYHCNATSAVVLSHYFISRMMKRTGFENGNGQKRGLLTFTSSGAAYMPSPMSAIYASTKSFLTSFAASLAAEIECEGIDVVCVHPSPIASRFYSNAGKMSVLEVFKKTALHPRVIADCLFSAAGRYTICDQGYFSVGVRVMLKALDWNALVEIMKIALPSNPDFKALRAEAIAKSEEKAQI
jgi:short-subunit dehydrogenase